MSSRPGLTLEDYLAWNFDLIVEGQPDANFSLALVESLGGETRRKTMSKERFAGLVAIFEDYRDRVEYALQEFDEDSQSWRDYAGYAFVTVPQDAFKEGRDYLNKVTP